MVSKLRPQSTDIPLISHLLSTDRKYVISLLSVVYSRPIITAHIAIVIVLRVSFIIMKFLEFNILTLPPSLYDNIHYLVDPPPVSWCHSRLEVPLSGTLGYIG